MLPTINKRLLVILLLTVFHSTLEAQVTVTDSVSADELVQHLVGTGISYANPVLKCDSTQSGTFHVINSNLGIGDGIILTTGRAETDPATGTAGANGDQNAYFASAGIGSGVFNDPINVRIGDTQLEALANKPTLDACILEFDFVPDGDSLLFNYVFGSEEYDTYSCSNYNDVFGFFLSGPGITGSPDIALIPGTSIPVAINSTTNPAVTQPGTLTDCQSMGPGSPFAQYYVDNSNGTSITYYGFTTILTARAAVVPCTTYHIKLAIADCQDGGLDSGVFLEANSFRSTNIKLDLSSSLGSDYDYLVEGCSDATLTVKRSTPFPIPQTVYLGYSGNAGRNIDYSPVPDSVTIPANDTVVCFTFSPLSDNISEGFETLQINVLNPCTGNVIDSVTFKIYDYLPYNLAVTDTAICQGKSVRLEVNGDTNFTWSWRSVPDGPIENPSAMSTTGSPDTTTVYYVSGSYLACVTDTADIVATVEPIPIIDIYPNDTSFCLHEPYQIHVNVGPSYFNNYTYLWTPAIALDDPTVKEPSFYINGFNTYHYMLTVQTPLGCTNYDTLSITTRPMPEITVSSDFMAKYGDVVPLHAEGATFYTWTPTRLLDFPDEPDPHATAIDTATFQVIGTDQYGCRDTAYVKMNVDYTMSESIPSAFSPNNDGRNDVFHISNLKYQRVIEFRVFNRWGQEVFTTTDGAKGWDGTFKGAPQEVGVYHYLIRITTPEGKMRTYKGDVTLIR
jgi:gliding motility-associated-like protein